MWPPLPTPKPMSGEGVGGETRLPPPRLTVAPTASMTTPVTATAEQHGPHHHTYMSHNIDTVSMTGKKRRHRGKNINKEAKEILKKWCVTLESAHLWGAVVCRSSLFVSLSRPSFLFFFFFCRLFSSDHFDYPYPTLQVRRVGGCVHACVWGGSDG